MFHNACCEEQVTLISLANCSVALRGTFTLISALILSQSSVNGDSCDLVISVSLIVNTTSELCI